MNGGFENDESGRRAAKLTVTDHVCVLVPSNRQITQNYGTARLCSP
jgi:hypothetical protein